MVGKASKPGTNGLLYVVAATDGSALTCCEDEMPAGSRGFVDVSNRQVRPSASGQGLFFFFLSFFKLFFLHFIIPFGGVVAQWVERRPRDPMDSMTRGSNPVRSTRKICESFSELKCCADLLSVCPTPVYTRTHKDVRTLKIL